MHVDNWPNAGFLGFTARNSKTKTKNKARLSSIDVIQVKVINNSEDFKMNY